MFAPLILLSVLAASAAAQRVQVTEGVIATGTMGPTNPPQATAPTEVNQNSVARLASVNAWDDWCMFGPPAPGETIGSAEHHVVVFCTKPRNNARVIPDGVLTGVSFIKTDYYVQVMAYGDFTKLNIEAGDYGGELDPHGPSGDGNPVGGNVTSNVVDGTTDVNYEEWMSFVSWQQMCFRICTNANATWSAGLMCEHELDVMGCEFVMPGNYQFNGTFESCEAEVAYPPGAYVTEIDGDHTGYSFFRQYYTGVYTDNGTPVSYTVGTTETPVAPQMTPSSSNCQTFPTITNGVGLSADGAQPTGQAKASGNGGRGLSARDGVSSTGSSAPSSTGTSDAAQAGSEDAAARVSIVDSVTIVALIAGIAAITIFH